MKENELLKYSKKSLFNSKTLQQYDAEGQRYFLAYLIKKGYNMEIKSGEIIFTDISSEDKIRKIIEQFNNDTKKQILRAKMEATRDIEILGITDYTKVLEKQRKELENKQSSKER